MVPRLKFARAIGHPRGIKSMPLWRPVPEAKRSWEMALGRNFEGTETLVSVTVRHLGFGFHPKTKLIEVFQTD